MTYQEKARIQVGNGPGMTIFRPDGKYGFVCSSFTPETKVVDIKTHEVIATVPPGVTFFAKHCCDTRLQGVLADVEGVGKTEVFSADPPFSLVATLDTGPITNHVNFVRNKDGQFAYISVGEENVVKVYTTGEKPELVGTIPTGELPHGIWPSGDGTHIYVALQNGTGMNVINTLTNKVEARISGGQCSQALVYVPNAVPTGEGLDHLEPLAEAGLSAHLVMGAPGTGLCRT
jgi:DNA-binding beta-propeller fold protein YncE